MRDRYPVSLLCQLLDVSRSGYYKWRRRMGTKNRYEKDRDMLTALLREQHLKHPSYGYHRLAVEVFRETGWIFSHNLAHKCCKQAGIQSKVIDAFNNEILAHQVSDRPGDSRPYYHVLNELIKLSLTKKEKTAPIVFHSDQGAVFSSRAFFKAHEQYTIQRSMSRIGTPTDNPVIEALNGWMKEELLTDFGLADTSDVRKLLDEYVEYYNHQRPAAALQYKSPIQFKHEQGF